MIHLLFDFLSVVFTDPPSDCRDWNSLSSLPLFPATSLFPVLVHCPFLSANCDTRIFFPDTHLIRLIILGQGVLTERPTAVIHSFFFLFCPHVQCISPAFRTAKCTLTHSLSDLLIRAFLLSLSLITVLWSCDSIKEKKRVILSYEIQLMIQDHSPNRPSPPRKARLVPHYHH